MAWEDSKNPEFFKHFPRYYYFTAKGTLCQEAFVLFLYKEAKKRKKASVFWQPRQKSLHFVYEMKRGAGVSFGLALS